MSKKTQNNTSRNILITAIVVVVFAIVALIIFIALPGEKKEEPKVPPTESESFADNEEEMYFEDDLGGGEYWDGKGEELMSGKVSAVIDIKDYGNITVELDADKAPVTVTNFVKLAKDGFYDGLTFHRIMEGFMMQGGDPLGNGTGGADENILGEFRSNGVDNDLSHTRGAISMARSQMYNSASSQFFICHEDALFLDGEYACFGYVTDGIDVVDEVCTNSKPIDGNGTITPENQPVINSVTIME